MFHFVAYAVLAFSLISHAVCATLTGKPLDSQTAAGITPSLVGVDLSSSMPRRGKQHPSTKLSSHGAGAALTTHNVPRGGTLKLKSTNGTAFSIPPSDLPGSPGSATLLLCENPACGGCLGFDLSTAPHNECLTPSLPGFQFVSVAISQPTDAGLPFAVSVSPPGCGDFSDILIVNTCFDVANPPDTEFALIDI
ncbi:hypothetical protein C8Q74DRAFT_523157 [Fomes fomentarius]|nr:hypothetical protein C8Q74DRAFT_523157 [Fomes fomentarius]